MDFVHLSEELRSRGDHARLAGRLIQVRLGRVLRMQRVWYRVT
jgi:hypothetical protein